MDFNELLSVANYNKDEAKSEASIKRYSTVLAPPKKPPKTGVQSDNIRRFLEKKKAEEDKKASIARQKKQELLELRAQSSKNSKKAKIMASRTKDNDFSRIKLTDDEIEAKKKREAELLRQNLMGKVERMKARIEMEEQEKMLPRKRKRKSKNESEETINEQQQPSFNGSKMEQSHHSGNGPEKKAKRPLPPPQMSFHELLRVAAVKQHEPVEIRAKKKDDDRPMTKKERLLMLEEQERLRRKQEMIQKGMAPSTLKSTPDAQNKKNVSSFKKSNTSVNERSSKEESVIKKPVVVHVEKISKTNAQNSKNPISNSSNKSSDKNANVAVDLNRRKASARKENSVSHETSRPVTSQNSHSKIKKDVPIKKCGEKTQVVNKPPAPSFDEDIIAAIEKRVKEKLEREFEEKFAAKFAAEQKVNQEREISKAAAIEKAENAQRQNTGSHNKNQIVKMDSRTLIKIKNNEQAIRAKKELLAAKFAAQNRNPLEQKPVPFHKNPYLDPPRRLLEPQRTPIKPHKRRIESDEDDEDDDMSDFIDDRPSQNDDDYSKYIRDIFGYDKSKYIDDDDDDEVIESSFVEQMKEEVRSAKLGYLEDLEEERKEKEEIKRKMKKKLKK